ncbi:hypothetical protein JTB14_037081 [Gonioctena quinquepunctata]|nr:hypothetical protein JTB14_037081 [Gonioctena quinquepunctata]
MSLTMKMLRIFAPLLLSSLFVLETDQSSDEYIRENFQKCIDAKNKYYCAKYNFLKFIRDFDYEWTNGSVVNFVKISEISEEPVAAARYQQNDSEFQKFVKFLIRRFVAFLGSHGLSFILPTGARFATGRSLDDKDLDSKPDHRYHHGLVWKDKKKLKKISIIVLFKLLKIKVMLSMTFFVVLNVLKMLLLAAMFYPTIYHSLTAACEKPVKGWFGFG